MSSIIDIFQTLNFVSNYNNSGGIDYVTLDQNGILTLNNSIFSSDSNTGTLVIPNGSIAIGSNNNATGIAEGGALTVAGGGAFSQNVYIGGDLTVTGSILYANAAAASSTFAYLTLTATDQSINLSTGSLITYGGITIQANANATNFTAGGGLTVAGGVGIGLDLYVGGKSNIPNIITTTISSSNLIVTNISSSNVTITNLLLINGLKSVFNSNTLGSIYTTNGNVGINTTGPSYTLDINGSFRSGGTSGILNLISSSTLSDILQIQNTNISGASTLQFLNNTGSSKGTIGIGNASSSLYQNTFYISTISGIPINFIAGNNSNSPIILNAADNSLSITTSTTSTTTSSGALKISGGVGIIGNVNIGGSLNLNSLSTVNLTNTIVSSNSTIGALILVGGLSINLLNTANANATSYTSGGGLTIAGGIAITQDQYIGGILDIQSNNNNLNSIKLQSIQFFSNSNNGQYSVIGSGNSSRTLSSFTPIRFTGWNDGTNPKLTINTNTIDITNAINATNNSNTIGNLFTTNGNVGINTSSPSYFLDVSGGSRITNLTTNTLYNTTSITTSSLLATTSISSGAFYSTNLTSTNIVGTTSTIPNIFHTNITTTSLLATTQISSAALYSTNITSTNGVITNISTTTLNAGNLTTGNINFTGTLSQNGAVYLGSQWTTTSGNVSYTSGNVIVGGLISTTNLITSNASISTLNAGNLTTGNINFTGTLSQNGTAYLGSQWTTTAGNLSYTSGNVIVGGLISTNASISTLNAGNLTTGNINFTGTLSQNGTAYLGSQWTTTAGNLSYTSGNVIVGGLISTSNLVLTNASFGTMSGSNLQLSGNITVGGDLLVTGSLISLNVTSINIIDNNITAGTINAGNATISNIYIPTSLTTVSLLATTQISSGALYSTNLTSTNIVGTSISSGTLNLSGTLNITNGNIIVTSGNITVSGNISSNNLYSTNFTTSTLLATTSIISDSLYSSNLSSSNVVITNLSSGTQNISGSLNITNGNIIVTSGNMTISGNISSSSLTSSTGTIPNIIHSNITTNTLFITTGGSLILNSKSSGSVTMTTQISSANYNFNLPTSAGISGQALISAGGGSSPMTWATPSLSTFTRYQTNATTVGNSTATTVLFDSVYTPYSIGSTGITYSNGTFTNSNSFTVTIKVNYCVAYNTSGTGHVAAWIVDSSTATTGDAAFPLNSTTNPAIVSSTSLLTLASGATFQLITWQNTGGTISTISNGILATGGNNTTIQITLLTGGYAPTQTNLMARYLSSTGQTIGNSTNTQVLFDTVDTQNSLGSVPLSYSSGLFTNTGTSPLSLLITASISYNSNTTGSRVFWIQDNNGYRYGQTDIAADNDYPCGLVSAQLTLIVGGTFVIYTWQNSGSSLTLPGGIGANTIAKIQISALTAGASGGTINAYTTSNTLGTLITSTNGNIGINTTTPGFLLDVNGVVNAQSGLRTNNSNLGAFKIVTGTVTIGSITGNASSSTSVTFSNAFGAAPIVTVTTQSGNLGETISYMALTPTTSGFTLWYRNNQASGATSVVAMYIAIGTWA